MDLSWNFRGFLSPSLDFDAVSPNLYKYIRIVLDLYTFKLFITNKRRLEHKTIIK